MPKRYLDDLLDADETVILQMRRHWWYNMRHWFMPNMFDQVYLTDRRLLEKKGVLEARTMSLALTQLESKDVAQSVWGRLFGFGDLTLHGSGGKQVVFKALVDPRGVSRAIGKAVEDSNRRRRKNRKTTKAQNQKALAAP